MSLGLVGRKVGMTRIFTDDGASVPVTVLDVANNRVTQIKTPDNDGYAAIQVTYGKRRASRVNKAAAGHLAKAGVEAGEILTEFVVTAEQLSGFQPGATVGIDMFAVGQKVDVTGTSKGKGFQGVIKRWHKNCGPKTHGSMQQRQHGSMSSAEDPGHVRPGTIGFGHMGMDRFTQKNLLIMKTDAARNLLLVRGAVPGPNGSYVIIQKSENQKVPVTVHEEIKTVGAKKVATAAKKPAAAGAKA